MTSGESSPADLSSNVSIQLRRTSGITGLTLSKWRLDPSEDSLARRSDLRDCLVVELEHEGGGGGGPCKSQRSMQDLRRCSSRLKRMESVLAMSSDFCLCMACSRFFLLVLSSRAGCCRLSCRDPASLYSANSISPETDCIA